MANYYNYTSTYTGSTTNNSSNYSFVWNLRPGQMISVYGDTFTVRYVEGARIYLCETESYIEIYDKRRWRWVEPNNDFETAPEEELVILLGG